MGLLDSLGLPPLDDKKAAAGRPLTSGDFPADAKRRKLADEEAKKRGKEITGAKPDAPGGGPKPGFVDKKIDALAGKGLDAAEKKSRGALKDTMPEFELFDELTPEAEFAEDMKKGIENAQKQIEFIKKTIDYAEKFGDKTALAPLSEAAKNLNKISDGVLGGLKKAGKAAALGKDVVVFFQSLKGFADASDKMSAGDGASVQAWVDSLKKLWNASKPFVDKLKDEAFTAALAGSEAAGALGATLAIVGAQLYIGIQALDAGVKVVNAYMKRLHEATREDNDRVVKRPDPPQPPLPFRTRAETIASIKKHDAEKKQLDAQREQNKKEAQKQQSAEQAKETFDTSEFPKTYRKLWRAAILAKVEAAWKASRGRRDDVREWWDCFIDDSAVDEDAPPDSDAEEIAVPPPRKTSISQSDANDEVRRFLDVSPTCPYFDAIYQGELKKYMAKALAPG